MWSSLSGVVSKEQGSEAKRYVIVTSVLSSCFLILKGDTSYPAPPFLSQSLRLPRTQCFSSPHNSTSKQPQSQSSQRLLNLPLPILLMSERTTLTAGMFSRVEVEAKKWAKVSLAGKGREKAGNNRWLMILSPQTISV